MAESMEECFIVWGSDQVPYGPVELASLVSWVKEGRVTAESWVFINKSQTWRKAKMLPELKALFGATGDTARVMEPPRIEPQLLRSIKILADFHDQQLERLAKLMELEGVPKGALVISQGEQADSLYFILEGELDVFLSVLGKEVKLTTLQAGDFCGDVALLNHGTRSASVRAASKCVLARLSAAVLDQISESATDVASPLLHALDETLSERIRADNERFSEILRSARQRI
jgi:CRP-like cAMP-binding protein